MKKYKLITSILGNSLFRFSITLGLSLGVALNSSSVLAKHVTNKWDVRKNLEADNWTVIYSEEFGTDDWFQLTLALVADASGCAGGCTSAFIQNFGYQSYNTIVQELGRKSPDMVNSFLSAMTKTDFGSLLASALKNGSVESRNLPGVRLQLGSSAYNRKECELGICVPLPNSHQPYIRVQFLAGQTPSPSQPKIYFPGQRLPDYQAEYPMYNSQYYLSNNPDVENACRNASDRNECARQHYLVNGLRECRNASPLFHPRWYLENNPDVKQVFRDCRGASEHWSGVGRKEGRKGAP